MAASVGVKVTLWLEMPTPGAKEESVQAKLPSTLAEPLLKLELAKVCPKVIAEAVGGAGMDGVPLAMVKVKVAVPVPPSLLAEIVALMVPDVVGVPEINPVEVFTLSPAGSPLAEKLAGEPDAVMVKVRLDPTAPLALVELVIEGAATILALASLRAAAASTIPPLTTLPLRAGTFRAVCKIISLTCKWVRLGFWDMSMAATPVTTGAERDVPELEL